jgi:putative flippase GtrA
MKAPSMPRQTTPGRLPCKIVAGAQELLARGTGRTSIASALRKLARYATVSAISTTVTLSLLGIMVYTKTLSPGWANVVATGIGTVPSFELNRRWVWSKRTKRLVFREMVPFCALSFSGLGLSTLMVSLAASWSTSAGLGSGATALISLAANLATFGALWVVQFFLLDRVLFGRRPAPAAPAVAAGRASLSGTAVEEPDGAQPDRIEADSAGPDTDVPSLTLANSAEEAA